MTHTRESLEAMKCADLRDVMHTFPARFWPETVSRARKVDLVSHILQAQNYGPKDAAKDYALSVLRLMLAALGIVGKAFSFAFRFIGLCFRLLAGVSYVCLIIVGIILISTDQNRL